MSTLRVVDLSETGIVDLPSSVSDLENLTAMFLRACEKLRHVLPLGKLRAFEIHQHFHTLWYFFDTSVTKVQQLSRLQVLRTDLIKVQGEELERLGQLEEFEGWLYSVSDFNGFVKSGHYRQLNTCSLQVGCYRDYEERHSYEKVDEFSNCSLKNEGEDGLVLLPHNIQLMKIYECHDVSSLCDVSDHSLINSAKDLKECIINHCDGIECILLLSSSDQDQIEEESRRVPLQSIEILRLWGLSKLSGLIKYRGGVTTTPPPGTLSNLKVLEVLFCFNIKKLLTPKLLQHLPNLERIKAFYCGQMEEIIGNDEENKLMGAINIHSIILTLPKLRKLHLGSIRYLVSIYRGLMTCDSLEAISITECPKLKRLPFALPLVDGLPSPPISLKKIKILKGEGGWWKSLEWDHPNAKDVLQPFLVIRNGHGQAARSNV